MKDSLAHLHQCTGRHIHMLLLGNGCNDIDLTEAKKAINHTRGGQSIRAGMTEQ
jgi:hypothetical protein